MKKTTCNQKLTKEKSVQKIIFFSSMRNYNVKKFLAMILVVSLIVGIGSTNFPTVTNKVKAATSVIYEDDFNNTTWNEAKQVISSENVQQMTVNPEEGAGIITTTASSIIGTVVWRFDAEVGTSFNNLSLIWQGRAIMGDGSYVKLYASSDGVTYSSDPVDSITSDVDYGPNGPTTKRTVDLTAVAAGQTSVYLKAELYNSESFLQWVNINYMQMTAGYTSGVRAPGNYEEYFTSSAWSSSDNVVSFENIQQKSEGVDENEGGDIITTTGAGVVGTVVWKFQSDEGTTFTNFDLIWQGRAIIGNTSYVKLYVSTDGETYNPEPVDEVLAVIDYGPNGPTTPRPVDLTSIALNHDTLYIKAELLNSNDFVNWVNINYMKVTTTNTGSIPDILDDNTRDAIGSQVISYDLSKEYDNITYNGSVFQDAITAESGDTSETYMVRSVAKSSGVTLGIPEILGTSTNLTMEVREIHKRDDGDINYQINLNGQLLYQRQYNPSSDGANHYFVMIPKELLLESGNIITIQNTGDQDVRIADIWLYENFVSLMEEEGTYSPLEVVLFSPSLTYSDYEADKEKLNTIAFQYSNFTMYNIGLGFDIWYMNNESSVIKARIDYLMKLASETGFALKLDLNSWWSGTPGGMDGQGGFWKDILYNQVIYDADNVNGLGVWQLSTPNMWSSTPWLTLNNEYYNQIRAEKLTEISNYIAAKTAEYAAKGNPVDVSMFTENEPIYWAYKHYNMSTTEGKADLSYSVIQQALEDGVNLDPTDGYTYEENLWLFMNLTTYISQVGDAIKEGAGNNAVIVNNGQISAPSSQLTEQIYSHMMLDYSYPIVDDENMASWEAHVTNSLRLGVESALVSEVDNTDMEYIIARGKYADVNAERSAMSNFNILPLFYEYGADHVIIFNYLNGDEKYITAVDNSEEYIMNTKDARNCSLWVEYRADDERIMQELYERGVSEEQYASARQAFDNGRYITAYKLLMEKETTAKLPITYAINGYGQLGDYPVNVTVSSEDVVNFVLKEVNTSLDFKVTSDNAASILVNWTQEGNFELISLGAGEYKLVPSKNGKYKSVNGVVSLAVNAVKYYDKDYPEQFDSMCWGIGNNTIKIESQDAAIGECVSYVELSLVEDCSIIRGADGFKKSYETAALSDLQYGDKVELTLNDKDEVTSIKAVYGHCSGKVKAIEYPVINGFEEPTNAFVTIEAEDGTETRYEISSITNFDYPTKTGNNIFTSLLNDYGLEVGNVVEINYSPYVYNGSNLQVLKLYQPYDTILEEDFEDETWMEKTLEYNNINIRQLDSNYTDLVATPLDKNVEASITWRLEKSDGSSIDNIYMQYGARSILNTSLIWYMSTDGGSTWEQIKDNEDWGNFATLQTIYKTGITSSSVLIKVVMSSIGTGDPDTWSSLNEVIIKIPSSITSTNDDGKNKNDSNNSNNR